MKDQFNTLRQRGADTHIHAGIAGSSGGHITPIRDDEDLVGQGDVNDVVNDRGETRLHVLCREGREDHIRKLIAMGADLDARDKEGNTPLLSAALAKRFLVAKWLVEAGADVDARNDAGRAVIHLASRQGDMDLLAALQARNADLDPPDWPEDKRKPGAYPPLFSAVQYEHVDFARTLIAAGADVNRQACGGETALLWAADKGNETVVRLLVENGAELDVLMRGRCQTALYQAILMSREAVAGYLVEQGADTTIHPHGETLLMLAASNGDFGIAKMLIEHGADLSARDAKGRDALQIVREEGPLKTAEKLTAFVSARNAQRIKFAYVRHKRQGRNMAKRGGP